MRKINYILLLLIVFAGSGCTMRFRYSNPLYQKDDYESMMSDTVFVIDNSFKMYLRKSYEKIYGKDNKTLSAKAEDADGRVVEKNFLLISEKRKVAIYVTYWPDKYQSLYYSPEMRNDSLLNMSFFRAMQFGKVNDNLEEITFTEKRRRHSKADKWLLKKTNDGIQLHTIEELKDGIYQHTYNLDEAFGSKVKFIEIRDYQMVYDMSNSTIFFDEHGEVRKDPSLATEVKKHLLDKGEISLSKSGNKYIEETIGMSFKEPESGNMLYLNIPRKHILYDYLDLFKKKTH